jgi:HSP20 family protein
MNEKDVDIQIENGVLTIKGERTAEKELEERGYRRIEREYGTFFRSFTLPVNIDAEKAAATFTNGLLEVQLPKKEGAKPKTIKVEPKKLLTKAA